MIDSLLAAEFFEPLCLTLLHSLWQVALLALIASTCCRWFCQKDVFWKYTLNVATLIVALLALPITFMLVESNSPEASSLPALSSVTALDASQSGPLVQHQVDIETAVELEPMAPALSTATADNQAAGGASQFWASLAFWATGIYLLGVAFMLTRLLISVFKANQLASQGKPINDGPAREILQSLCSRWSLQVMPRLMQAEQIVVPKVVSLIRPAILLPASAITGLSSDQLEMILAHELAHIHRHDMWVNLLQRVAEALLFFNPTLWFLSRRISDLREYCCDEMACEIFASNQQNTVEPRLRYAQALLRVVELRQESSSAGVETTAALAAIGHSPSELRRRVARLFDEPLREPIRISRTGVCFLLAITMLCCSGPAVWSAATKQSNVNAPMQQEPAEVAVESQPSQSEIQSPQKDVEEQLATVAGRIVFEDGSPADVKGQMFSNIQYANGNGEMGAQENDVDKFSFKTRAGTIWLGYNAEGYAPVWTDEIELASGEKRDDIRLVLQPGVSTNVRVSDKEGQPVAGATIVAHPEMHGTFQGPVIKYVTNKQGEYKLTHLADTRYRLKINAPGYEPLVTAPLEVEEGQTLVQTIIRSQPSTGTIRFADGTPAPLSKIRCLYEYRADGGGRNYSMGGEGDGFWGTTFATADKDGRFELDTLTKGSRYVMVVQAADGTRAIVHSFEAGKQDVQIDLPRRHDLVVKIKGDLSKHKLPFINFRQKPYSNFKPRTNRYDLIGAQIPVKLTDDGGTAVYRGLAVDLDGPKKGPLKVFVDFGYDQKKQQSEVVELNPTGETVVEFDMPFPTIFELKHRKAKEIKQDLEKMFHLKDGPDRGEDDDILFELLGPERYEKLIGGAEAKAFTKFEGDVEFGIDDRFNTLWVTGATANDLSKIGQVIEYWDNPDVVKEPEDILWGEAKDGVKLGIRPSAPSKHPTQFRQGDRFAYEVWIKNETKSTIHVPYDSLKRI